MSLAEMGRFIARGVTEPCDLQAAQALRARCFDLKIPLDQDAFDARCRHIGVHDSQSGMMVCTFRILDLNAVDIGGSYAGQYYNLSALRSFKGRMLEIGRFCIDPDAVDLDVLRTAWAAIAAHVDAQDVKLLFGCVSFAGIESAKYNEAFALLGARYLAPKRWMPGVKAFDCYPYSECARATLDVKTAMVQMPPLLRTYLRMGGWVSDHAVVDHDMNTIHVFTAVEIAAIPAARKRFLRALQ